MHFMVLKSAELFSYQTLLILYKWFPSYYRDCVEIPILTDIHIKKTEKMMSVLVLKKIFRSFALFFNNQRKIPYLLSAM